MGHRRSVGTAQSLKSKHSIHSGANGGLTADVGKTGAESALRILHRGKWVTRGRLTIPREDVMRDLVFTQLGDQRDQRGTIALTFPNCDSEACR